MKNFLIAISVVSCLATACGNGSGDKAEQDSTRIQRHADTSSDFPNTNNGNITVDTLAKRDSSAKADTGRR